MANEWPKHPRTLQHSHHGLAKLNRWSHLCNETFKAADPTILVLATCQLGRRKYLEHLAREVNGNG